MKKNSNNWKAGLAQVDITPKDKIRMAGYSARTKPSLGVHDPLMAKALLLEDCDGNRGLMVSLDLIAVSRSLADEVFKLITEKTGIPRENIVFNCSHTHSGPLLGRSLSWYYNLSASEMAVVQKYTDEFCAKIANLAVKALKDLQPARLDTHLWEDMSWQGGAGTVSFMMNRRRYTPEGVINAPYPRGFVDRSVPVMRVTTLAGKLRGVLFGLSCHCTTLGKRWISADYAGYAQRLIEKQHQGVQAMFLQGCGADSNPWPRGTFTLAGKHGEALGKEVCRVLEQNFTPVNGPLKIAFKDIALPLEGHDRSIEILRRQSDGNEAVIEKIKATGKSLPKQYHTALAIWQFGQDLTMVRLSGEVVSDYIPLIGKTIGHLKLWIMAYCDDCFAYVPSDRVFEEGGYEARDFITGYGFMTAGIESVLLNQIRKLAKQAGRILPKAKLES